MRILLSVLLPLLLPVLLYALWAITMRGRGLPPWWRDAPWPWILGVGVALAIASVVIWGLDRRASTTDRYEPPRLEGDRIVPGRSIP